MRPPPYYERVRSKAAARWDQLEGDPDLAGPWQQLFLQVQSPRHVLSELLQNADDAGATEASARVEGDAFVFTHDGEDFTEEHFTSLCRFGYSNKRALHTIGFRGVGFKSTFSLGPKVELSTQTLSVSYDRRRFTEPTWVDRERAASGTCIRVVISDGSRIRELAKNLQEWISTPASLLFFKHIRRLRIDDQDLHWGSLGPGPVPGTEWMALHADPDDAVLVVRSGEQPFPDEALQEIRQERLLADDGEMQFPPCRVELVMGAKGRLYVVLPTGVTTELPFACNAPFLQDPARLKVKDPETSPTNRWLLERAGALAASVMLAWIGSRDASLIDRASAYALLPDVDRDDASLEGTCGALVEKSFEASVADSATLLTEDGNLVSARQAVIVPDVLLDVWPDGKAAAVLDAAARPALCHHIERRDREKLLHWRMTEEVTRAKAIEALQSKRPPTPGSWRRLLALWAFVAPDLTGYAAYSWRNRVCIVPAQGKDELFCAADVVRLGEKRLLHSDSDWDFLSPHLLVMNPNWPRYLADQRRATSIPELDEVEAAFSVLEKIGLAAASDANAVVERIAGAFFGQKQVTLQDCVRLAQITARLGARAGEGFQFATRDKILRTTDQVIVFDRDGSLAEYFRDDWWAGHGLHPDYSKAFASCTEDEWTQWIAAGQPRLHEFAPLEQTKRRIWGRRDLEQEFARRGGKRPADYPYKNDTFEIEDWDFGERHWDHWTARGQKDPTFWCRVVARIFDQPLDFWSQRVSARAWQLSGRGDKKSIATPILPSWLLRLRDLPCLSDTRDSPHKPSALLRRTPETESFIDVEAFVHSRLDREATRPLLDLLGVRATPTGPDRILDCLRALAKTNLPPVSEVEKWYRRLDHLLDTCSTPDLIKVKKAFREERIVFTETSGWVRAPEAFLFADEENVPGAAVIRPSVRDLVLWRRIEVAEHPTADLAISWLRTLPLGTALDPNDLRRVRALVGRYSRRVWDECRHWLNLAGEWAPTDSLSFSLTMQTLIPWSHLHKWVKQQTADLQRMPLELTSAEPFSALPSLASQIEDRFERDTWIQQPEQKAWLRAFGEVLARVRFDDEQETARVRELARRLSRTTWQRAPGLAITPYLHGTPAGTPRQADATWLDTTLFVGAILPARLAKRVPEEIGGHFARQEIRSALDFSFERSATQVREYLEENFDLAPAEARTEPAVALGGSETEIAEEVNAAPEQGAADAGEAEPLLDDSGENESAPQPVDSNEPQARDPKPAKPSILERFARARGFQRAGDNRFRHADGSWIARSDGRFPWEKRSAGGDLLRLYWPKDHCLERDPLEIEADIWALLDQKPELYALILADRSGAPIEVPGARLRAMRDAEQLTLYPAAYRLVVDDDK